MAMSILICRIQKTKSHPPTKRHCGAKRLVILHGVDMTKGVDTKK